MSQLGGVLSKLVQINRILICRGSEGAASSRLAIFIIFFARNRLFSAILITFRTFSELFERTKLLKFENRSKEINFPSP